MSVRDLIPWNRGSNQIPTFGRRDDMDPFLSLHRNINRLFDETLRGFDAPSLFGGMTPRNGMWPSVEFSETDKEIQVTAELPGLEENDLEVLLEDGVLTLRGEKNSKNRTRIVSSANATTGVLSGVSPSVATLRRARSRQPSRTGCSR
ncbi:HSP20 family protein [Rhizobium giardinii]|uniref:HSP20 family protein n=1 Tax=Rhizobium giardinii TaxID=56731 RepID=A0A7W8UE57_9HYPH|nr:HSP20 family protein [Rhizobium giardinii]